MVILVKRLQSSNALTPIEVTSPSNFIIPVPFLYVLDIIFTPKTLVADGVIILPSEDVYQISLFSIGNSVPTISEA